MNIQRWIIDIVLVFHCSDQELVGTIKNLQSEVVGWKRLPTIGTYFQQQPQNSLLTTGKQTLSLYLDLSLP